MVRPGFAPTLNYSPAQQGYDASVWKTVYGTPFVAGGYLCLTSAEVIHYGQIFRGEATFIVNVPTAAAGGGPRAVGLYDLSTGSQAYFYWDAANLFAIVRNASDQNTPSVTASTVDTTSSTIAWNSAWTSADISMKIRWEAGLVKFFINGVQVAVASESTSNDWNATGEYFGNVIPTDPLSIFLMNQDSDVMKIKSVNVHAIQSYFEPTLAEGSISDQIFVFEGENITVTDVISLYQAEYTPTFNDTITITESYQLVLNALPNINDAITVTDVISIYEVNYTPEMNDAVTITENIALSIV